MEEAGSPSNNLAAAEACLLASFHRDPSDRFVTVHRRHRQTDTTDRLRSDSIGRTVLQTVAQKPYCWNLVVHADNRRRQIESKFGVGCSLRVDLQF